MAFKTVNYGVKTEEKKVFVGRNQEKSIFWDNFRYLKEHLNRDESKILSYYGFTSGGKTSFCKQIVKDISEKNKSVSEAEQVKYLYYDFKQNTEYRFVLESMCEDLKKRYNFFFAMFDYAWYVYNVKNGVNQNSKEMKYLIKNSKILTYMVKSIGVVPVDNAASVFKRYAEKGNAVIRKFISKHQAEIKSIEKSRLSTLEAMLVKYFAADLWSNLSNVKEPFIIFFDSYEQLVGELSESAEPLENDLWLRNLQEGEEGLLLMLPNTLWVIAGREKLKWGNFSDMWDESALEQHELENFCEEDTVAYLNSKDIFENDLCLELHELTGGKRVALDACAKRYEELTDMFEDPRIEEFTNSWGNIAEDMLKYIDEETKDLLYLMASMDTWTDESFSNAAAQMNTYVNEGKYIKIMNSSYVEEAKNQRGNGASYRLREDVAYILSRGCPFRNKEEHEVIENNEDKSNEAEHYNEMNLENSVDGGIDYTPRNDEEYIENDVVVEESNDEIIMENSPSEEEHKEYGDDSQNTDYIYSLYKNSKEELYSYVRNYQMDSFEKVFGKVWNDINKNADNKNTKGYVLFVGIYLLYLTKKCNYVAAEKYFEELKDNYTKVNLTKEEKLDIESIFARVYYFFEEYQKAYELDKEILERRKELLGEENLDTLTTMDELSVDCLKVNKFDESYSLIGVAFEARKKLLGMENLDTLTSLRNLANSSMAIGENEKAFDISRDLYEKSKVVAGRAHPDTTDALSNIGHIYAELQMYQEALNISHKICDKYEEVLGLEHVKTLEALIELAHVCTELNLNDEVLDIRKKVYDGYKKMRGDDNIHTLTAKFELAKTFRLLERYKDALNVSGEIYDKYCSMYGIENPNTKEALKIFGISYEKLGIHDDKEKAEIYRKYQSVFGDNSAKKQRKKPENTNKKETPHKEKRENKEQVKSERRFMNRTRATEQLHNTAMRNMPLNRQTIENAPMPNSMAHQSMGQRPMPTAQDMNAKNMGGRTIANVNGGNFSGRTFNSQANRMIGNGGFANRNFNSMSNTQGRNRGGFGNRTEKGNLATNFADNSMKNDNTMTQIGTNLQNKEQTSSSRRRKVSYSKNVVEPQEEEKTVEEKNEDEFTKLFEEVDKAVKDETNKPDDIMDNFKVSLDDVDFENDGDFEQFMQFDSGIEIDSDYFKPNTGYTKADDWE